MNTLNCIPLRYFRKKTFVTAERSKQTREIKTTTMPIKHQSTENTEMKMFTC